MKGCFNIVWVFTNGCERNEAIVHGVEVGPLFFVHEHVGGNERDGHGEKELDRDELEQAHFLVLELEAFLEAR